MNLNRASGFFPECEQRRAPIGHIEMTVHDGDKQRSSQLWNRNVHKRRSVYGGHEIRIPIRRFRHSGPDGNASPRRESQDANALRINVVPGRVTPEDTNSLLAVGYRHRNDFEMLLIIRCGIGIATPVQNFFE
jgi:hypothetical protein